MKDKKIVTFGEILLRLNPEGYKRFTQAEKFEVSFVGAEANAAVSLSNFGLTTQYVTKIPENAVAHSAYNALREQGVGVDHIVFGGERIGLYYIERGNTKRNSNVIYDRKYSAISMADINDFDWEKIFCDADAFFVTGISAAISKGSADICRKAIKSAKAAGVRIYSDTNYRSQLWTKTEAREIMNELLDGVYMYISSENDAKSIFEVYSPNKYYHGGELSEDGYQYIAEKMKNLLNIENIAFTNSGYDKNLNYQYSALMYYNNAIYKSTKYNVDIIDRVGVGDSFAAGLIYSLETGREPSDCIEFAAAAAVLKHTVEYDFNLVSVAEVEQLIRGESGGIKR